MENTEIMQQLEFLESELKMIQDNISRIKEYKNDEYNKQYRPYNSRVVGEFKHRITALKQRLTLISKITTRDIF